ncbi:2-oxoacid:ferredoxin oxidoreductase subunit beta [Sporosalibacterium faouarense]|uniref:2-oxoacid:ferredoxin oxidoreductase subunit beta n=1 Tax=Sporosalibacterium faouarense TaxID=516123 RepID=UPI00141C95AD|nr:2-oxoacid:ferredoxin oxidoreductase subunit beta [Sporosalibacterium faouarense]MTI49255.1 2-oxoacid:ferredoxin oxidoreductase subunit beta [Bacillota bacterium]
MATDIKLFESKSENSWCPGCGNFGIVNALKKAFSELDLLPHNILIASGIGQAAKTPHYVNANGFNGLHGRGIPPAVGAKIANKDLRVIVTSGDGDSYGEGGNHLIHNIRRNIDITHLVHNNQIYGLTKGQGSPTTGKGHKTSMQFEGVYADEFNPIAFAISLGCSFVARSFSADKDHLSEMIKAGMEHNGYALIDILQPCVTFNKINTYKWYKDRVYYIEDDYNPYDKVEAFKKSQEWENKIPIGVIYKEDKPTFIDRIPQIKDNPPLINKKLDPKNAIKFMEEFK